MQVLLFITSVARNEVYNFVGGDAVQFGREVSTCWGREEPVATIFRIGNEDSRFLGKVDTYLPNYTGSDSGNTQSCTVHYAAAESHCQ